MGFKIRKKSKVITEAKYIAISALARRVGDAANLLEQAATELETYIDRECPDERNHFSDTLNRCVDVGFVAENDLQEFEYETECRECSAFCNADLCNDCLNRE